MKIRAWKCNNCGHEEPLRNDNALRVLNFKWLGPLTSRVSCPACKAYTIQRAYDKTFKVGNFLVVTPKNQIKGKG
jgi:predicted RNA-binding Zn-ribbon protein involved in translation (DUF1610 family)